MKRAVLVVGAIVASVPLVAAALGGIMIVGFYLFAAVGEATGWWRIEDYITMP